MRRHVACLLACFAAHSVSDSNLNRVAEVWLDEYKELYYEIKPHHRAVPTGDISERVALRQRLQCKPFKWYLDNVFPDMFIPLDENVHARGNIR